MTVLLLIAGLVMISCVLCNRFLGKLGVPMLLAFILLGMLFGSDGLLRIPFDDYSFAEQICSAALIFIMFYGGFGTSWKEARPVVGKAALLSTLGVVLTAALVGAFCHFALGFSLLESFLVGAVISSTDAASVFFILRSKKLGLKYHTASLLEVESGSNDPCSYMLTTIVLTVMVGGASAGQALYLVFSQVVYGGALGVACGLLAVWFMRRFSFSSSGFESVFAVAVAVLSYALPAAVGGNGYLSTYIAGILLGNANIKYKQTLVPFFDGVTNLMQMLLFFLLGLLSYPSRLGQVILPALAIFLFLTFVARPAAVFGILSPFKSRVRQQLFVSWAGMRGAASIVFAVMVTVHPAVVSYDIFHIVLLIVLLSILFQGSLLPAAAKKLDLLDAEEDVMRTFTDYVDEVPVQFIRFCIPPGHTWENRQIKEIVLPPGTILVLLQRGEERLVPTGETALRSGDTLILSALAAAGDLEGVRLSEKKLTKGDKLAGRTLAEAHRELDALIVMIQRQGEVVIPSGSTQLLPGDVLVLHHAER